MGHNLRSVFSNRLLNGVVNGSGSDYVCDGHDGDDRVQGGSGDCCDDCRDGCHDGCHGGYDGCDD